MHEVRSIEHAILVGLEDSSDDWQESMEELEQLTFTAGAEVVDRFTQKRSEPNNATYIGHGKAEELAGLAHEIGADLVIFDGEVTPTQQRNLAKILELRVVDRTQLILDIFAQRAHTREGNLQVELAQYHYLLPRLAGSRTDLSRLGGGIGTRGPGETKLEADRRRVRKRITDLEEEIEEVRHQRERQRASRRDLPFHSAALVGYTSAGKSTLMNLLSGAELFVDQKLFATLDPTTRRVDLDTGWSVLLTDTVGFIRNLPHDLVAAFRATLEEVRFADFLIHVVDISHPHWQHQHDTVLEVLGDLDADRKPIITVLNKIDKLPDTYEARKLVTEMPNAVYISAEKNDGIPQLMQKISQTIESLLVKVSALIPYTHSDLITQCYGNGRVEKAEHLPEGTLIIAHLTQEMAGRLEPYRLAEAK